ncbi:MAG: helix-turn-helix domain-containing protein [Sphingobacteriaceae bacterium]
MGKMVATILYVVAETKRLHIVEPTNEGRLEAKSNGIRFGKKPSVNNEKVLELRDKGIVGPKIAKQVGIGRSAVYKVLRSNHFKSKKSILESN